MEKNDVKKELYKKNPTAIFLQLSQDGLVYISGVGTNTLVYKVPLVELGEGIWPRELSAKLLIRYIINAEEISEVL